MILITERASTCSILKDIEARPFALIPKANSIRRFSCSLQPFVASIGYKSSFTISDLVQKGVDANKIKGISQQSAISHVLPPDKFCTRAGYSLTKHKNNY